ncbi:MAG: ABC transporter ATP-binding protein [Candidatus Acidiferrales bacterium]
MSEAVFVDKISKKYELGTLAHETMLVETLARLFRSPFRSNKRVVDTFWALKDVSFGVEVGEVVGIIGRNGAGKSTLLKILSKITYPTSGSIRVHGRVASLLEVGTGFHEELTGRENVFLNGSILGMKQQEVARKLDEIVAFAGVERFLDTPIKRYSSGMRLRLGFAVAAHLDPDVLIVDEVLAVGDAAFQKKCLSAMSSLRSGGRTVLFVSHNMAAVENLCTRAIWIDHGQVKQDGESRDVITNYMATFADTSQSTANLKDVADRRGSGELRYTAIEFLAANGETQPVIRSGDSVTLRLHFEVSRPILHACLGIEVTTDLGTLITDTSTWHHGLDVPELAPGPGYIDLEIDSLTLLPGRYFLTLGASDLEVDGHFYDLLDRCAHLDIESSDIYESGRTLDSRSGIVYFPQRWLLNNKPLSRGLRPAGASVSLQGTKQKIAP